MLRLADLQETLSARISKSFLLAATAPVFDGAATQRADVTATDASRERRWRGSGQGKVGSGVG